MITNAKVINVRGTLCQLQKGEECTFSGVRESSLRHCASVLRELGLQFRVNKIEGGDFRVTRMA